MPDQTLFGGATSRFQGYQYCFDKRETEILRGLAGSVAESAARPVESAKRKLWYSHNALHPTRPVIFCDPENGWKEIVPEEQLKCTADLARAWEMLLRKEIFWGSSMGDDRVTEPSFDIPFAFEEGDWGMHDVKIGGQDGGAYTWEPPLKDYDLDLPRLKIPVITINREATARSIELAGEVFGDLLNVRSKGVWWWSLGMTSTAIALRGIENFMMDFHLFPDQLKKLMGFLRDGHLAKLDFLRARKSPRVEQRWNICRLWRVRLYNGTAAEGLRW